jgi:hypothetical protein
VVGDSSSREVDWKNGKVQIWHEIREKAKGKLKPVFGSVSNYNLTQVFRDQEV